MNFRQKLHTCETKNQNKNNNKHKGKKNKQKTYPCRCPLSSGMRQFCRRRRAGSVQRGHTKIVVHLQKEK
jgi:hypothetical protein